MGVRTQHNATVDDQQLKEERQNYSLEGKKEPGFASAVVPTLEEKTIVERRPPPNKAEDGEKPIMDEKEGKEAANGKATGAPEEARVSDASHELYGAPADASKSPQTDDEPPHARGATENFTEEERAAVGARKIIRKHLNTGVEPSPWALPVPAPKVDPHGFEDPVCDAFWKDVWVACAVHNVCEIFQLGRGLLTSPDRLRSSARSSTVCLTTQ